MVFLFVLNRKTTPASRQRTLRDILSIARPPLLAVKQGGEYAAPTHFDIFSRLRGPRLQFAQESL